MSLCEYIVCLYPTWPRSNRKSGGSRSSRTRLVSERVAGEYHSVFKGQGIEFEEVRPYAFGDEIRSIDWNVTARVGAPHVKRFREEREMTVFLVVDLSGSCQFASRGVFKSELMAEVSAVLALAAVANNDRVGLILATDRLEKVVPPRKGRRHVLRLVREVLGFEPRATARTWLWRWITLRHVLHRRSVVFIIRIFLVMVMNRHWPAWRAAMT